MDPATYITDKANKDKADKACFAIHYNCNRIAGFPHVVSIWSLFHSTEVSKTKAGFIEILNVQSACNLGGSVSQSVNQSVSISRTYPHFLQFCFLLFHFTTNQNLPCCILIGVFCGSNQGNDTVSKIYSTFLVRLPSFFEDLFGRSNHLPLPFQKGLLGSQLEKERHVRSCSFHQIKYLRFQ